MNETFEQIWENNVVNRINDIAVTNGFENDICFLEGWMIHYAEDINKGRGGKFWPAVTCHPVNEEIAMQARADRSSDYKSRNSRQFVIELGFDVDGDPDTIQQRMESGYRDIKKALSRNKNKYITLQNVAWASEEGTSDNMYIIIQGTISYTETWGK